MMKTCDCHLYPRMHDSRGVCVNWDLHDKKPCDFAHSVKEKKDDN